MRSNTLSAAVLPVFIPEIVIAIGSGPPRLEVGAGGLTAINAASAGPDIQMAQSKIPTTDGHVTRRGS